MHGISIALVTCLCLFLHGIDLCALENVTYTDRSERSQSISRQIRYIRGHMQRVHLYIALYITQKVLVILNTFCTGITVLNPQD